MSAQARPTLYVVAGPNGSGKSTITASILVQVFVPIIDPDAIARGIRSDAQEAVAIEAGREALRRQEQFLALGQSFAIETTLAGHGTLRLMEQAGQQGFTVQLVFICIDNVQTNIERVAERTRRGGHYVPDDDVRRRYERSLGNLRPAIQRAHQVTLIDNSTNQGPTEVLSIREGSIMEQAQALPRWVRAALGPFLDQQRIDPR